MKIIGGLFIVLALATSAFAQPSLGPDCGVGASLAVGSTDLVGKVTLGTANQLSCTLTVVSIHNAACGAEDESGPNNGHAFDAGPVTSVSGGTRTLVLGPPAQNSFEDGDTISYHCMEFDDVARHHH